MNLEKNREVMIEKQHRPKKITNSDVLQAFMNTSKEQFISEDKINICYSDQDIFIKSSDLLVLANNSKENTEIINKSNLPIIDLVHAKDINRDSKTYDGLGWD